MKRIIATLLIISTVVMTGCASNMSSRDYSAVTSMQKMKVELGVVESVRNVKINGKPSPIGGMAGGALGAIAGSNAGGGIGQLAVMVVAGAVGAAIGAVVDKKAHDADGIEVTVKMISDGSLQAVTQAKDPAEVFAPGDSVRMITGQSGFSRVTH